jgi:hypothetical protein
MEAFFSAPEGVQSLPLLQGDFACGQRKDTTGRGLRGDFASGVRGTITPLPRHAGDFAAGVRSRVCVTVRAGDFARGVRTADADANA